MRKEQKKKLMRNLINHLTCMDVSEGTNKNAKRVIRQFKEKKKKTRSTASTAFVTFNRRLLNENCA